jgi:hypothetical protein
MTEQPSTAESVRKWIEKTGLPLEMEAAAAFRRAGFFVRQASAYSDEGGEKSREIDVLATTRDLVGIVDVSFVVECKASPNPWVVLTSEDAFSAYNRLTAFAVTTAHARKAIAQFSDLDSPWDRLVQYIELPEEGGYGFRQAFSGHNDTAYGASMSVLKACRGVFGSREFPCIGFAFPVIVVDAPLFECALSSVDNDIQMTEVQSSRFIFSAYMPEWTCCCISVVRRSQLDAFAQRSKKMADSILTELKPYEARVLDEWRTGHGKAVTEREDSEQ